MNIWHSLTQRFRRKEQQFFPQGEMHSSLPRTLYHYSRDVQQGFDSNVVMAPVQWIMRTFTEGKAVVESRTNGVWKPVEDHAAEVLIDQPNEDYDGDSLWKATCISYTLNGNAYWRKVRNVFGDVIQLWYVPHWQMAPKRPPDGSQFISHYEYMPGGPPIRLAKRDVVHFRFGLGPQNDILGLSPLRALMREIFVDDEAANFSAKILANMGVPGLMVSPKNEAIRPSPDDLQKFKSEIDSAVTGDNRGSTLVMGIPTDVHQFGFNPSAMTLGDLRDVAEERVCATLGIPAAVVGFGSGLQSTKVGATMRELVRLAWVQCLIPMQHSLGRQLTAQLLPDFVSQTRRFRMRFDDSEVSAFQEEDDLLAQRIIRLVTGGVLRVDRAQDLLGLEVDTTQEIYMRPSNSIPIDKHGKMIADATPNGAAVPAGEETEEPIPAAVAARRNGTKPHDEEAAA
jgi:HK97 family phage portal protein